MNKNKDLRAEEFLNCLGNGKTIYQIEEEDEILLEELKNE